MILIEITHIAVGNHRRRDMCLDQIPHRAHRTRLVVLAATRFIVHRFTVEIHGDFRIQFALGHIPFKGDLARKSVAYALVHAFVQRADRIDRIDDQRRAVVRRREQNFPFQSLLRLGNGMLAQRPVATASHILKRLIVRHAVVIFCCKRVRIQIAVQIAARELALGVDPFGRAAQPVATDDGGVVKFHRHFGHFFVGICADKAHEIDHPVLARFHITQPYGVVPIGIFGQIVARFRLEILAARFAMTGHFPVGHIKEQPVEIFEFSRQLVDLYLDKIAIGKIIRAAQPVALTVIAPRTAVCVHHLPLGVVFDRPVIEDQAVIPDDLHTAVLAFFNQFFDLVFALRKPLMRARGFGGIIANPHVRLQIDHRALNFGAEQIFVILVRVKLR